MATQTQETPKGRTTTNPTPEVTTKDPAPKRGRPPQGTAPPVAPPVTPTPTIQAAPAKEIQKEKPHSSGITVETSQLVRAIGAIVLGLGILGLAIWWFGSDFIMMALYIALPLFVIFVGLRLMSYGTLQLIWNGELKERVTTYLAALEATK